ncbi:beta-N-acetylhexosaminidase [Calidifontibacillus erzurumensis]|uniref:beta-N-acetylhexosaminidase n=1 Tax=Calidifontibacillus erzurumensis TaxID=2741433 RepID=A0A8J8GJB1_9BACI|nr:beta-N-acetylhexosaminidase [Calidifontibacillus erzurumensis]NSL52798.1 beta-N-acetylhexosaminidase [Calidifontibacillus erzurumensis]
MFKKVTLILALILATVAIFYFLNGKEKENIDPIENSPNEEERSPNNDNSSAPITSVSDVLEYAMEGKVPHFPFISGETSFEEVKDKLGDPEDIETVENGAYANYLDQDAAFGYRNGILFDVRSYHPELQEIRFNDIKQAMGEPDKTTYYKDNIYDQIILMYQLNENYQLKWILPRPTDNELNPAVHHISVLASTFKKTPISYDQLTLDEKIGQMIFAGIEGTKPNEKTSELIYRYKVGGIIFNGKNIVSPKQTIDYMNHIQSLNADNPIPIMFGIDQEGGRISKLPGNLLSLPTNEEIGKINDPAYSYEIGSLLGKQLKAFGFHMDFAPVLDVNSNPNNPVIGDRSFGNDPDIVSRLGIQTMKGIQSQNVISVIKHFPGHGDTSVDSHLELPVVNKTRSDLEEIELIPFKKAIKNGADVVMVGHIMLPKIDSNYPSTMSKKIIQGMLRKDLEFHGVVITDDMTMKAITNNFDIGQAAVQSVKAGSDIIMVAHDYEKVVAVIDALKKAVEKGEISEKRINESVERILELKKKYNVQNKVIKSVNIDELNRLTRKVLISK